MAAARADGPKSPTRITTLKRRPEFLRVRKGARSASPAFVLEGKGRTGEAGAQVDAKRVAATGLEVPRFGFTVTRQVGKAVERNRIRRRLKAAVAEAAEHARADFDYVLIARRPALTTDYRALVSDLARALDRLHRSPAQSRPPREGGKAARSKSS